MRLLITTDLDDTLWPMAPVLAHANHKLLDELRKNGVEADESAFKSAMDAARSSHKHRPPYSQVRTEAIARLATDAGQTHLSPARLFRLWLRARHDGADRHLHDGVIGAFGKIRNAFPDAVIVALTNGAGDPLCMRAELAACFDLTVSGEDPDIHPGRKPSPLIFERTLERAGIGPPAWAHVGDDLLNDVDASKALNAATVWLSTGPPVEANPYSTTRAEERAARDALRAAVPTHRADRVIRRITELPAALQSLCDDGTLRDSSGRPGTSRSPTSPDWGVF